MSSQRHRLRLAEKRRFTRTVNRDRLALSNLFPACSNTTILQVEASIENINEVSVTECLNDPDYFQCVSTSSSDTSDAANCETDLNVKDFDCREVNGSDLEATVDFVVRENFNDSDVNETIINSPSFFTWLSKWAVEFGVNHAQVNGLLILLRSHGCHSDLPCDACAPLKTPRKVFLEEMHPGEYYHFGLLSVLRSVCSGIPLPAQNLNIELAQMAYRFLETAATANFERFSTLFAMLEPSFGNLSSSEFIMERKNQLNVQIISYNVSLEEHVR